MSTAEYMRLLGPEPDWQECSECGERWAPSLIVDGVCESCRPESPTMNAAPNLLPKVPPRYRFAVEVDLPANVSAWNPAEQWALIFHGPNGSGKTTLATAAWLAHGDGNSIWLSAKALAQRLRESVRTGSASPAKTLAECPLLLLDDFRAVERNDGQATAFIADELEYILTERDNWLRPTILTMDKPISGLGPRLASRLSAPYALPILLDGKDRRKEGR